MILYVTEPQATNMDLLRQLLDSSEHEVVTGSTDFQHNHSIDVRALIIRSQTKVSSNIKDYFPNLEHVIRLGTGIDNIDQEFCRQAGITIHHALGANSEAVADYTIMLMLMSLRRMNYLTQESITSWSRSNLLGQNMSAQTIGIIGYGHIGRAVHARLTPFNPEGVMINDSNVPDSLSLHNSARLASLDELLAGSSIVTLHLPLLTSTRHLLNMDKLNLLQDGAVLINAARGGLVDEAALLELIEVKNLIYIADSVENEPNINPQLIGNPRVIITPHIAGYTKQSSEKSMTQAIIGFLESINQSD